MFIENDLVIVETIQTNNIEKCVLARKLNKHSFFGQPIDDASSKLWIEGHRESENDVLLEIIYKPTLSFVGTIGFCIANGVADIGRISLYTPELKRLINGGADINSIQNISISACELILEHLFVKMRVEKVTCEILENNHYSNLLCKKFGGIPSKAIKEMPDGTCFNIFSYSMDREQYLK